MNPRTPSINYELLQEVDRRKRMEFALRESEERLRLAVESTGCGTFTYDYLSREIWISREVKRLFGIEADEPIPLDDDKVPVAIYPADRAAYLSQRTAGNDPHGNGTFVMDYRIIGAEGNIRWLHIHSQTDFIGEGDNRHPYRTSGIVLDITERKQIEENLLRSQAALRASEDRYRAVVEDQTEVISRFQADSTITFVNEIYCRFFGKTQQELLGKKWHPVVVPEDLPQIEQQLKAMMPANPVVVIENRIYTGGGEVRWMQFVNRGLYDREGQLIEIQSVGRDITDRKQTEEAIREAESRLRLALTASQMGVWDWDIQTNSIYWSPECFKIFGVETFGETYESFAKFLHPDDTGYLNTGINKAIAERTVFCTEFRIIRPSGEIRWLSNFGEIKINDMGQPVRMIGTVHDITERKRAEEKLRVSEQRYSALFANKLNAMAHCRVITDEHGRPVDYWILQINEAYERIIGIKKADIEGRTVKEVFPGVEHSATDYIGILGKIGMEGGEITFEGFLETTRQYLSIYAYSPLPGEFTAIFTDITAQIQSREQINLLRMELMHAGRLTALGELASGIAHEINQPLTVVATWAEVALREMRGKYIGDKKELLLALRHIETSIQHAGHIVNYMKDFAKKSETRKAAVSLKELLDEVIPLVELQLRLIGVELAIDLDPALPTFPADRILIQQLLLNLILNAVEAMKSTESGTRQLKLRARLSNGMLEVALRDTGCGISPDALENIFLPFQTTKPDGMGLGLSISRTIVENHGGKIWASCNPDCGATVTFTLPLEKERNHKEII